jgi:hypothetical protein
LVDGKTDEDGRGNADRDDHQSGEQPAKGAPRPTDMRALIERAREDARRKRAEAGLPPLSPDELEQPRKGNARRGSKRSKNWGQWL